MASNYTSNYKLCQWEASDKVLRTEFNEDNAKIDAALAGKADVSVLADLGRKADRSELEELVQVVSGHGTKLNGLNCKLYIDTYKGDGKSTSDASYKGRTLSFPGSPLVVILVGDNKSVIMIRGERASVIPTANGSIDCFYSLGDTSVTWYSREPSASGMMNVNGCTYAVAALLQVD